MSHRYFARVDGFLFWGGVVIQAEREREREILAESNGKPARRSVRLEQKVKEKTATATVSDTSC